MNKLISISSVVFLLMTLSGFTRADEAQTNSNSTVIYIKNVGGPYTDTWYLDGELSNLFIFRNGKSGFLRAPIAIDCKSHTLKITGVGKIWHEEASAKTLNKYLTKEITDAAISHVCTK